MTTPKQSNNNLMLLYSYLSLLPYILRLPQINSENKPSLSEDVLINCILTNLKSCLAWDLHHFNLAIISGAPKNCTLLDKS